MAKGKEENVGKLNGARNPADKDSGRTKFPKPTLNATTIFEALSIVPLIQGVILGSGFVVQEVPSLVAALLALYGARLLFSFTQSDGTRFWRRYGGFFVGLLLLFGGVSYFFHLRPEPFGLALMLVAASTMFVDFSKAATTPREVLVRIAALNLRMFSFAILGLLTQAKVLLLPVGVLGLVLSSLLSAYYLCVYAKYLEQNGWRRGENLTNKDGSESIRPKGTAMLLSLFSIFGVTAAIFCATMGWVPQHLLFFAPVVFGASKISAAFLNRAESDIALADRLLNLSGLTAIGGIVIVLLIRQF